MMESGVSRFLPRNHDVTHDEKIHLGAQEAIERLFAAWDVRNITLVSTIVEARVIFRRFVVTVRDFIGPTSKNAIGSFSGLSKAISMSGVSKRCTFTVREMCDIAFRNPGLNASDHIVTNDQDFRPAEVDILLGNPAKVKARFGWMAKISVRKMISEMVEAELKRIQQRNP